MKIIYNAEKGRRFKKGSIKVKSLGRRLNIFDSIECQGYWWHYNSRKWIKYEEWKNKGNISSSCGEVNNVKQLIRHMKKHSKYLPKGTKFTLLSRFKKINGINGVL